MTGSIKDQIRKFLLEDPFYLENLPRDFSDEESLLDSGALDSIGIFNLVVFLESNFNIHIQIGELSEIHFASLSRIEKFVEAKILAQDV